MPRPLRSLAVALGLLMLGGALSGCIIDDGWHHHGWCWWHDCR